MKVIKKTEMQEDKDNLHTKTEYSNLDGITWNYYSTKWNNKLYGKY